MVLVANETGADKVSDGDEPLHKTHWGLQATCADPTQTLAHHQNAAVPSRSTTPNDIDHSLPALTSIYHPPTHPRPHPFLPLLSSIYRTPLIPSTLFHSFHLPTSLPSSTFFTHSITHSVLPLSQSSHSPSLTFTNLYLPNTKQPLYFTSIPAITTNQEEHVCNFQLAEGWCAWRGCG